MCDRRELASSDARMPRRCRLPTAVATSTVIVDIHATYQFHHDDHGTNEKFATSGQMRIGFCVSLLLFLRVPLVVSGRCRDRLVTDRVLLPFRCWICSLRSSWITSIISRVIRRSWAPITWMSFCVLGRSTIPMERTFCPLSFSQMDRFSLWQRPIGVHENVRNASADVSARGFRDKMSLQTSIQSTLEYYKRLLSLFLSVSSGSFVWICPSTISVKFTSRPRCLLWFGNLWRSKCERVNLVILRCGSSSLVLHSCRRNGRGW